MGTGPRAGPADNGVVSWQVIMARKGGAPVDGITSIATEATEATEAALSAEDASHLGLMSLSEERNPLMNAGALNALAF